MIYRKFIICCVVTFTFLQCEKRRTEDSIPDEKSDMDTSALSLAAELYRKKGDFVEAIKSYSELIDLDSTNKTYLYRRGISYSSSGEVELAIEDCERALYLGFDEFKCRFELGMLYYDLHANKDSLARANLNRCLQLRPNSPKVLERIENMDRFDAGLSSAKKKPARV
ncbi:MAG TPA: tetratricopeptide repeat protein [Chryseolinea sp.]